MVEGKEELEDKRRAILLDLEKFQGKVNLIYLIRLLLILSAQYNYDPETYEYPIGRNITFYRQLNRIREFIKKKDFFNLGEFENTISIESPELKFILKLNDLYVIDLKLDDMENQLDREKVVDDLLAYGSTSPADEERKYLAKLQAEKEGKRIEEIEREIKNLEKKKLNAQPSKRSKVEKELKRKQNERLYHLRYKSIERAFINITSSLTKKDIVKEFKKESSLLSNREKLRRLMNVIEDLLRETEHFLEIRNKTPGERRYFTRTFNEIIQFYKNNGLSNQDFLSSYSFFLCPFLVINGKVILNLPFLEIFLIFLEYYFVKTDLLNWKGVFFEEECLEVLNPLQTRGIRIAFRKIKKEQIDILLYLPNKNAIIIVECTDEAPLYFPFIDDIREKIRQKTKKQLERKRLYLLNNPKILEQLFRTLKDNFTIGLVGVSRIKCENFPHIKFFTLMQLGENPELIIK